jgi:hypothetical protein
MAPLGEWSLEATNTVGARGMSGTVASSNGLRRRDIPSTRSPPTPRHGRRTGQRSGGFREQSPVAHWMAIAFGERTQLAQGKRPAAAALGYEDPRPQALRAWKFASLPGAHPSARAGPADRLGFFVPRSGPSFGISCACPDRRLFPFWCGHRCCSSTRSAASRRDGPKRSAITVATQQLMLRPKHVRTCESRHNGPASAPKIVLYLG